MSAALRRTRRSRRIRAAACGTLASNTKRKGGRSLLANRLAPIDFELWHGPGWHRDGGSLTPRQS
ncbi:hypothetical protein LG3211_5188 [Lysobacter gummosus]|nr:hypothetical protein LG3211_5188 [Lysobacter gummosus]